MKAIALLYHDIVSSGAAQSSGFVGGATHRYKIDVESFEGHVKKITGLPYSRNINNDLQYKNIKNEIPLLFTFDDGGISAHMHTADLLEKYGWRGYFFVTTDYVGKKGFLTKEHIVDLWSRGHIIGTHSKTHPDWMANCSSSVLLQEWRDSRAMLEDVVGSKITCASVPGGYFSDRVAEAASESQIETLFTSEPVLRTRMVKSCHVIGRFSVISDTLEDNVLALAKRDMAIRLRYYVSWNARKLAKRYCGSLYSRLRNIMLDNNS